MERFFQIYKNLLLFLTCVIDFQLGYMFFDIFFERRSSMKKTRKVVLVFLLGVVLTFIINLAGHVVWNILSMILLLIYFYLIFDVKIGNCFFYWIVYIISMVAAEILTSSCIYFESLVSNVVDYSNLVDFPATVPMMLIIKYIPIQICKQLFTKSNIKMKTKTFLLYILIPIVNVMCISFVCLFQFNIANVNSEICISIYSFLILVGSYLIFYSFQRHTNEIEKEYLLMESQMKSVSENELLYLSAKAMRNRLKAAEDKMETERIIRHDRRHFEGMLYELLEQGNAEQAKKLLEKRLAIEPAQLRRWCDNETINATVDYYVKKAQASDVPVNISLNIPKELSVDSLQLAIALSNLMENAIIANEKLPEDERFMNMKAVFKKQLLISIENACCKDVKLNENGLPFTTKEDHGIGTKSVLAFVQQNSSEVLYSVENGVFTTQLMIKN